MAVSFKKMQPYEHSPRVKLDCLNLKKNDLESVRADNVL